MKKLITALMISASCYAQHPYLGLTATELQEVAKQDGYRVMAEIRGDEVVYNLNNGTDSLVVAYRSGRRFPMFVIYREE